MNKCDKFFSCGVEAVHFYALLSASGVMKMHCCRCEDHAVNVKVLNKYAMLDGDTNKVVEVSDHEYGVLSIHEE
jgi:hypothetical protein